MPVEPVNRPKTQYLRIPNAGEDVKQENSYLLGVRMQTWQNYIRRHFVSFLQNETNLWCMIQPSWSLVFTQRKWKLGTVKKLPTAENSFTRDCQHWETKNTVPVSK